MSYTLSYLPPASTPVWIISDGKGAEVARVVPPSDRNADLFRAAVAAALDVLNGNIIMPVVITDQTCFDLMCTAIEGGINYWADVGKRTRALREGETIPDYTSFEADVQDGPVSCDHPDIEAAEIGRFTIDPGMIRDGIRRLLAPGAQISPAIRNDVLLLAADPEHGPDADSADAIVQFAVFGELVFG